MKNDFVSEFKKTMQRAARTFKKPAYAVNAHQFYHEAKHGPINHTRVALYGGFGQWKKVLFPAPQQPVDVKLLQFLTGLVANAKK
jgi:hypothetical protein